MLIIMLEANMHGCHWAWSAIQCATYHPYHIFEKRKNWHFQKLEKIGKNLNLGQLFM